MAVHTREIDGRKINIDDDGKLKATSGHMIAMGARALAITVGIGAGVGAFIGNLYDSGDQDVHDKNATAISANQNELDQVQLNIKTFKQNAGETCVSAL
jgi:hypothetical protein